MWQNFVWCVIVFLEYLVCKDTRFMPISYRPSYGFNIFFAIKYKLVSTCLYMQRNWNIILELHLAYQKIYFIQKKKPLYIVGYLQV
jgi:hypothetical protein